MNEKTRLEQELERVQNRGKQWRGIVVLLVALLLFAALYIVSLRRQLYDAHDKLRSLTLEADTLRLEIETLKLDAARCADETSVTEESVTDTGNAAVKEKDLQTPSVE